MWVAGRLPVHPEVQRSHRRFQCRITTQEPLEAVVDAESEALEPPALEPHRPVLRRERVVREQHRVEVEPRHGLEQDARRLPGELIEVDHPSRRSGPNTSSQPGEEVRVAAASHREVPLVGRVEEVRGGEGVGVREVLLDRELRRDAQARLLVLEERDRAGDRLPQHEDDARRRQRLVDQARQRLAAVEVGRCRLEPDRRRRPKTRSSSGTRPAERPASRSAPAGRTGSP